MVSERPFSLKELFKLMSVWSASLIFEMRTFVKKNTTTVNASFLPIVPKSNIGHFKKKSEFFV